MERMPWFKWWNGTTADPKFRMIAEQCNVSVALVLGVWAHLLEYASKNENRGSVDGIDVGLMAYTLLIKPEETVETVCNGMKRVGLVTPDGEIAKWMERQAKRENQEPPGASTKRVQAMRQKQKALQNNELSDSSQNNDDVTNETDETTCNDMKRHKKKKESREDIKPKSSSSPDGDGADPFDRFWSAYPNRVGKINARKSWNRQKLNKMVDTILLAIEAQTSGAAWMEEDGKYIPHPTTWLNGGHWLDEVQAYVPPVPSVGRWWATKETMEAMGRSLVPPLTPNPGEYPKEFAARIEEALERAGKPEPVAQRTPYMPPMPANGDDLTHEQRAARLAAMKLQLNGKTRSQDE